MGRYYDLLGESELSDEQKDFIADMEKETIVYWQKVYGYSEKEASEYVKNNRKRIINEHKNSI